MECAPIVNLGENFGKQNGELIFRGNTVDWHRYGYVYRKFTMESTVLAAIFTRYARRNNNPNELWVVIVCDNRLVHSFGLNSGSEHVIGIDFKPKSVVACGHQGVVFTSESNDKQHLEVSILQGPEELLNSIVPSSMSSPLRSDDKLVFCDDDSAVVWNKKSHIVKAYSLRLLQHQHHQTNHLTSLDARNKAAVLSPVREWTQQSIGKVFSQTLHTAKGKMILIASHDPELQYLYVLCGPDLMQHENVEHVAPVAGVHHFPGVFMAGDLLPEPEHNRKNNKQNNINTLSITYSCLFFPNLQYLCVPFKAAGGQRVVGLKSEQTANWVDILLCCGKHKKRVALRRQRIALSSSIATPVSTCLDIVNELYGPTETATCLFSFLSHKASAPDDLTALSESLDNLVLNSSPTLASQLIIYLHILREDLSLLSTHSAYTESLGRLIKKYITAWGDDWTYQYGNIHELSRNGSGNQNTAHMMRVEEDDHMNGRGEALENNNNSNPYNQEQASQEEQVSQGQDTPEQTAAQLPCTLSSPPSIFLALLSCINPEAGRVFPDIPSQHRFFPNITLLLALFQTLSSSISHEDIKMFLVENDVASQLELFTPGIRACLLEVINLVVLDSHEQMSIKVLDDGSTSSNRRFGSGPSSGSGSGTGVDAGAVADSSDGIENTNSFKTQKITRGLFRHDLRYNEAVRLLQTKEPQKCLYGIYVNPDVIPDHEIGRVQKEWGEALASRALDTAFGRAALQFSSRHPLLWEQFEPEPIDFSGECTETMLSIPPVYKSILAAIESHPWKNSWGVFAHGAALGLSVSPQSPGIDSLWVITSAQLNSISTDLYSGFVYGMGLSGHLATLEDWQFYESLVNSNSRGTLAALLGVAASKLGSRDAKLTKVLSVHIRALLPSEAHSPQLVPPEVECAALISLGLLYMGQGVRHLTEVLGRDLVWTPPEPLDGVVDGDGSEYNEAHKLAVGIALGLMNCGCGSASGLNRLASHVTNLHDRSVYASEIINGVICAILLTFIGSNDEVVAKQLELPRTRAAAEYSTPQRFFGRALVYHLVLWDRVGTSTSWALANVPQELRRSDCDLSGTRNNNTDGTNEAKEAKEAHEINHNSNNKGTTEAEKGKKMRMDSLWYLHALAGVLTAMAMRHTGSNNEEVVTTLLDLIEEYFYKPYESCLADIMELIRSDGLDSTEVEEPDYDLGQTTKHLANLLSSLALAVSAVAAGSGNLRVLRLLRRLWQVSPQVQDSVAKRSGSVYITGVGLELASISQAIGWLFMSSCQRSFKTDPASVGLLCCFSFLDVLGGANIMREQWQHLKLMWSLLTEQRCLYAEHDPSEEVLVELKLKHKPDPEQHHLPVVLPSLNTIEAVAIIDERYVMQTIESADLPGVLENGVHLTAKETGRYSLESMLPLAQSKTNWDSVAIRGLRATLQAMASSPSTLTELEDLRLLLAFSEMWPLEDDSRLLKKRDIEQLKFLQWYSMEKH